MPTYGTHVARTTSGSDPLVPEPLATAIIQEAPKASAALSLMNKTTLSSKTQRMPVLDVLPVAYWVGGDTGMKQTSTQAWKNVVMVVEEIACIVPIPEAYLDDADVPLWGQIQPRITEAVGQLIDLAVLWGINKPTTWGEAVFPGAGKSQHFIVQGTGVDLGQDVTKLGAQLAQTGYTVNGFAAMPGTSWNLAGLRSAQGVPIYQPDMTAGPGGRLYGYPMPEINNGSWQSGLTGAVMLCGDFTKSIIGIRSDISFKMFTEGVISNDSGAVILNLMQQDSVAMRMTMRLAYATVNPVTIMQPGSAITARWPFGAILPVGATPPGSSAINVVQTPPYPYVGSFSVEGMTSEVELEGETETDAMVAQQEYAEEVEAEAKEALSPSRRSARAERQPAARHTREREQRNTKE
ncbi:MAG TPA: phage major capsid protein [Nitrospiraceae bacterium]|nr:phage major capsid protein [Nitrospiraceae bacterium]